MSCRGNVIEIVLFCLFASHKDNEKVLYYLIILGKSVNVFFYIIISLLLYRFNIKILKLPYRSFGLSRSQI